MGIILLLAITVVQLMVVDAWVMTEAEIREIVGGVVSEGRATENEIV